MNNSATTYDFLVIGSGLAGLTAALELGRRGRVLVASKVEADECNSFHAQGGVACVIDPDDTIGSHVADTLDTGCGLSVPTIVEKIVKGAATAFMNSKRSASSSIYGNTRARKTNTTSGRKAATRTAAYCMRATSPARK